MKGLWLTSHMQLGVTQLQQAGHRGGAAWPRLLVSLTGKRFRPHPFVRLSAKGIRLRSFVNLSGKRLAWYPFVRLSGKGVRLRSFVRLSAKHPGPHQLTTFSNFAATPSCLGVSYGRGEVCPICPGNRRKPFPSNSIQPQTGVCGS